MVLAQLLEVSLNSQIGESQLCIQLGLDVTRVSLPCGELGGAEKLKAALTTIVYADSPASFLQIDELSNNLDIPSLYTLESFLYQHQGTLIVVSHDEVFLSQIERAYWLLAGNKGLELSSHQHSVCP